MKGSRAGIALLVLCDPAPALDLFLSFSQGYTHYEAADLNRILVLLEKTTQASGFNNYAVSQFDGHPQRAVLAGVQKGRWRIAFEAEFWTEAFGQNEVAFDLEKAERDYRLNCTLLRDPAYVHEGLAGCVEAEEVFNFLPLTLQLSREFALGRYFRLSPGIGLGIMAGSAYIRLKSEYFGKYSLPDDEIRFSIHPGINLVQKYFADFEFRPFRFLGLQGRAGWRISRLGYFELRGKQGDSRVFRVVFPDAENGANLYIQSLTSSADDDQIYLGSEAKARAKSRLTQSRFHLVEGDFTGWFAAVKMNFYWSGK